MLSMSTVILWSDSSSLFTMGVQELLIYTCKGANRLLGRVYSIVLAKSLLPWKTWVKTAN